MYLDPSFGGMLIQVIIAMIAGGGAIVFSMRRKIKAFFKEKKGASDTANASSTVTGEVVDMMSHNDERK